MKEIKDDKNHLSRSYKITHHLFYKFTFYATIVPEEVTSEIGGWKEIGSAMTQALERIGEPYYYVVKFLEKPYSIVDDHVCVPEIWTTPTESSDWIVSVAYPEENPKTTAYRAKKGEERHDNWRVYQAIVKYIPNSYNDAEIWIARHHATVKNKSSIEKDYQLVPPLDEMSRSSGHFPSSPNNIKFQTVLAPSKPSQKPMIRVSPVLRNRPETSASGPYLLQMNENRSQTANEFQSIKQFKHVNPIDMNICAVQSSSNLIKNSSQQPKRPVEKQYAPVFQNFPQEVLQAPEVRRHIPVCVENLVREIHTEKIADARSNNAQIMMLTVPTIQTPSNEANQSSLQQIADHIATPSQSQRSQSANDQNSSNTQSIRNETTTEQNNTENAPQSPTEETRSTERQDRKPKYNPNNSKWTLKYRKRERGLQELVQYTDIYVNAIELAHCRRSSDNCNTLARMLLKEVFSHKALTSCSLINVARDKVPDGNKLRPELDEFAIKVILKFVEDYGSENQWDKLDYKSVIKSMNYEISKIRAKYGK